MARVYLLSAAAGAERTSYNLAALEALEKSAQLDRSGIHQLIDDPAAADLILFADLYGAGMHFEAIRRHPLVKMFREKCFIFCSNAFVIPFLPGVYASIEKRWFSARTRSGFHVNALQNEFASFTAATDDLPYLFSFMGSTANAPVRKRVATLRHPRAFFRDTVEEFDRVLHDRMTVHERRDYHRQYVELTKASKFILCPRGLGAATIRLFESMRMGRVPVIIADPWVEPEGPAWNDFSIRVNENDIGSIPRLLERHESEAVAMGMKARQAWEQWFSDEAAFHRVVEWCLSIRADRRIPEAVARWPVYLQLLRPVHLRLSARKLRQKWRRQRQIESEHARAVEPTGASVRRAS